MRLVLLAGALIVCAMTVEGCARPQPLAAFATSAATGSPLRLVVWNQAGAPIDLEVTVGGAPLFVGRAGVASAYPMIVAAKEVYVKPGTYRVVVRDRTRGIERSLMLHLHSVANVNVMLNPGALLLGADEVRHPIYQ